MCFWQATLTVHRNVWSTAFFLSFSKSHLPEIEYILEHLSFEWKQSSDAVGVSVQGAAAQQEIKNKGWAQLNFYCNAMWHPWERRRSGPVKYIF